MGGAPHQGAPPPPPLCQMEERFLALESGWNTVNLLNLATDTLERDRCASFSSYSYDSSSSPPFSSSSSSTSPPPRFAQLLRRAERALLTRYTRLQDPHLLRKETMHQLCKNSSSMN